MTGETVLTADIADLDQLFDLMHEMAIQFEQMHGKEPLGFVLGPKEWLMFKMGISPYWVKVAGKEEIRGPLVSANTWNGFAIHVKTTPGIDLVIEPDMAYRFLVPKP